MQGLAFWLFSLESPAGQSLLGRSGVGWGWGTHHGDEIYQMPAQNEADA